MTPLSDGTITVRLVTVDDTDAMYDAVTSSIAEIYPWMEWCHPEYSRDESRQWLVFQEEQQRNGIEYACAIIDNASGQLLGTVGINQINRLHRFANLGYWVRTSATRRGIATAATCLLATFGLTELELERVEIVAAVDNHASRRVAERSGALLEGILRKRLRIHGRSHDAAMHAITTSDQIAGRALTTRFG